MYAKLRKGLNLTKCYLLKVFKMFQYQQDLFKQNHNIPYTLNMISNQFSIF